MMVASQTRNFRKNANPSYYNMRFKPSNGLDNVYFHSIQKVWAPHAEPTRTNKDPNAYATTHNIFNNQYMEYRMRAADYLYQTYAKLHRSNDWWTKTLIGWTAFSGYMFTHALVWKVHFAFFGLTLAARIRDRGAEPSIDEVWVLDQLFKNERLGQLFSPKTYHVIDYDQEWEEGFSNPYFPEYRTHLAQFFNTDMNTTTGNFKIGDVESGATMTLHFKTMPFSNNRYNFTEPFMVYDMWAEVSHNGEYFTEHLIKAEEHLKTKRIFVTWH
jgi:hypothetical protein